MEFKNISNLSFLNDKDPKVEYECPMLWNKWMNFQNPLRDDCMVTDADF